MIYFISLLVLGLDILTKYGAMSALTFGLPKKILPFFNLYLVGNTGISFSMFSAKGNAGVWTLIILSLAICTFIIYLIQKEKDSFSRVALAMVLGGALGNILDRIQYGFVIDFLDFHWRNYHFPAFNIADSFICIGVCLLLFKMMKKESKK